MADSCEFYPFPELSQLLGPPKCFWPKEVKHDKLNLDFSALNLKKKKTDSELWEWTEALEAISPKVP